MSRRLTIALIVLAATVGSLAYLWLSFPSGMLGTMDYRVLDSQLDRLNSTGPPAFRVARGEEDLRRM